MSSVAREFFMKLLSGSNVRVARFFGRGVRAKIYFNAVYFYSCVPFTPTFNVAHTFVAGFVTTYAANISHVLRMRGQSKIFPSIIEIVLVPMVDVIRRPTTCHYHPDYPVSLEQSSVDADQQAALANAASNAAGFLPPPRNTPIKKTSVRIVLQKLSKLFSGGQGHITQYAYPSLAHQRVI